MTTWSEARLKRLFERYNELYWKGRMRGWRVVVGTCPGEDTIGQCEWRKHRITIDVEQHPSDREVRSTLLHEMCHAAERENGHGPAFFASA